VSECMSVEREGRSWKQRKWQRVWRVPFLVMEIKPYLDVCRYPRTENYPCSQKDILCVMSNDLM